MESATTVRRGRGLLVRAQAWLSDHCGRVTASGAVGRRLRVNGEAWRLQSATEDAASPPKKVWSQCSQGEPPSSARVSAGAQEARAMTEAPGFVMVEAPECAMAEP